jgi:hypothetical protein
MSALAVLFLIFDGVIKMMRIGPVLESFAELGVPVHLAVAIGTLELVLTVIYLIPRTAIPGAILWTGYLGGAIAIQARIGAGWFPTLFPLFVATLLWGGLFLRESHVRSLIVPGR